MTDRHFSRLEGVTSSSAPDGIFGAKNQTLAVSANAGARYQQFMTQRSKVFPHTAWAKGVQAMCMPPLTCNSCPVTYDACGPAR